jgi:hypothetical protein
MGADQNMFENLRASASIRGSPYSVLQGGIT